MGFHTWFRPSPTRYFIVSPLPTKQKYEHFLTVLPGQMNVILLHTIHNLSHFFIARSESGFLQPKALHHYCSLLLVFLSPCLSHCIHLYLHSFFFAFLFIFCFHIRTRKNLLFDRKYVVRYHGIFLFFTWFSTSSKSY
jgi:hypothetical protein